MRTFTNIVLVAVVLCTSHSLSAQERRAGEPMNQAPSPEEMQAMFKKWTDTMTPGAAHKALDRFVGEYNITMRIWMAGPGGPPSETKGTSTIKWVLDKRFLMEELKSKMLMPSMNGAMSAVPYNGIGILGYDNYRNMYEGTWTSNMQTNMIHYKGGVNPSGQVFNFYGEMDEPMLDIVGRYNRYTTKIVNNDKHVFEIFDLHAGENYKVIEIVYERKK